MASIYEPEFDEPRTQPGFGCRRARLGRQVGSERVMVSYPDSGKLGVSERRPDGSGLHAFFAGDSGVDYYAGEQAPSMQAEQPGSAEQPGPAGDQAAQ